MCIRDRINPFRAELSPVNISREPSPEEMENALSIARDRLGEAVTSRSCLREREGGPVQSWITVFPDGSQWRRDVHGYRRENEELFP